MASAAKKYQYVGLHADTMYKGDKAVPVGHGMDPISLSDDELNDERNAGVKDNFVVVDDKPKEVKEGEK